MSVQFAASVLLALSLIVLPAVAANEGGGDRKEVAAALAEGTYTWCTSQIGNVCLTEETGSALLTNVHYHGDFIRECEESWALDSTAAAEAAPDADLGLVNNQPFGLTLDSAYADSGNFGGPGEPANQFPVQFTVNGEPYAGWFHIDVLPNAPNGEVVVDEDFEFGVSLSGSPVRGEIGVPLSGDISIDASGEGVASAFRIRDGTAC